MWMMFCWFLVGTALSASPVEDAIRTLQQHSPDPIPMPNANQLADLAQGTPVKMRIPGKPGAPDGAMILVVSELSRQALWLGSADSHGEEQRLIAHDMPLQGNEMFRWYGLVDLPRPFADRHFLIKTVINTRLAAQEAGMWERTWTLEPNGEATMRAEVVRGAVAGVGVEQFDAALFTPANSGGWLVLDLPDGRTLFGYHAVTSLGGDIPDGLVSRYAFWGLDEVLRTVFERAAAIEQHYTGDHPLILGGDGRLVPHY